MFSAREEHKNIADEEIGKRHLRGQMKREATGKVKNDEIKNWFSHVHPSTKVLPPSERRCINPNAD